MTVKQLQMEIQQVNQNILLEKLLHIIVWLDSITKACVSFS